MFWLELYSPFLSTNACRVGAWPLQFFTLVDKIHVVAMIAIFCMAITSILFPGLVRS